MDLEEGANDTMPLKMITEKKRKAYNQGVRSTVTNLSSTMYPGVPPQAEMKDPSTDRAM